MASTPLETSETEGHAARLERVLETTPDAVIIADEEGRIEVFNSAAERMFGYRRHELIGQSIGLLMPEPDGLKHSVYINRYLSTGSPHINRQRARGDRPASKR